MAGGVHQLRAMFEKVNESSSPERGRSGASSAVASDRSITPLSKIRTSFIEVSGSRNRSLSMESTKLKSNSLTNGSEKRHESNKGRKNLGAAELSHNTIPETAEEKIVESVSNEKLEKKSSDLSARLTSKALANIHQPISEIKTPKKMSLFSDKNAIKSSSSPARNLDKTPKTSDPKRSNIKEKDTTLNTTSTVSRIHGNSTSKQSISNTNSVSKTDTQSSLPPTRMKKLPPKSPTKPMKPPASPKAHSSSSNFGSKRTASAIPYHSNLKRTSSRTQPPNRSQSRMSTISNVSSIPRNQISKKSMSTCLPEKSTSQPPRQSLALQSSASDSNYLTRLMRPTTSSASKTADKSKSGATSTKTSTRSPTSNDVKSTPPKSEAKTHLSAASRDKNPRATRSKNITSGSKISAKKQPSERILKSIIPNQKSASSTPTASTAIDNGHKKALGLIHTEITRESSEPPTKLTPEQKAGSTMPPDGIETNTSLVVVKELNVVSSNYNKDLVIEKPVEEKTDEKLILPNVVERDENGDNQETTSCTAPPKTEENIDLDTSTIQYAMTIPETETNLILERKTSGEGTKGLAIPLEYEKNSEDQDTEEIRRCENTSTQMEEVKPDSLPLNSPEFESGPYDPEFSRGVEQHVTNPEIKQKLVESQIHSPEVKPKDQNIKEPRVDELLESTPKMAHSESIDPINIGCSPIRTTPLVPKDLGPVLSTPCLPLPSPSLFEEVMSDAFPSPVSIKSQSTFVPGNLGKEFMEK